MSREPRVSCHNGKKTSRPLDNCQPVGKGINAPPSVLWEHSVESTLTTSQGVPKGWRLHCYDNQRGAGFPGTQETLIVWVGAQAR